jgi:hypothetical protein
MDITTKITRDVNQFKSVPASQVPATTGYSSTDSSSGWSISSIFTPYTIGLVLVILAIFGAWFAWDWYKTHHKQNTSTTTDHSADQPIGGSTVKPINGPPPTSFQSQSMPPVVTTMSPIQYAKYQSDQKALETALGAKNQGGGGEPVPDDAADGAGKAGWCYIGEDQGLGVCASVQPKDQCMSGQVYSTESECRQK